jgi:hypothetical protein
MKNFVLIFLLLINNCTSFPSVNNDNSIEDSYNISIDKPNEAASMSLLFEIPIIKGSYLEKQREDNWDYPKDLQVKNGIVFILSSEEKKIIGYDKSTKQFISYEKINQRLINEKQNNSVLNPIYLRILKDYIVVGYDFSLLIFSQSQEFLYRINFDAAINYITGEENSLNIWFDDFAERINLEKSSYANRYKIEYGNTKIDFSDIIVAAKGKIATQSHIYSIENKAILTKQIEYKPYNILPNIKQDGFSLNNITPEYYVWYPWPIGSKLVLIKRDIGTGKIVDLGFSLTKNNLYYEEDREGGLKISNEGNFLYALIMIFENGQKKIKVYQIDIG